MDVNQASFWQARYDHAQTGWDLGAASPPLQTYFAQLTNKDARILIVGAGNAYEASYLHELHFTQVYVLDFVAAPLQRLAHKHPDFDTSHLLCCDFFDLDQLEGGRFVGFFDLIIEQTFLCAIDPTRRSQYAQQMHRLLGDGGKLVGMLFDRSFEVSPPFGGSLVEYRRLFAPYFELHIMAPCYNSAKPRAGTELFIKLIKT